MSASSPTLILASSSPYRRTLLERLKLDFRVISPEVDESARPGESPPELAQRLALAKALAVARRHPDAIVIGSDQVADLNGRAIGKPGNHEHARAQLLLMSGQMVVFHTAVALVGLEREVQELVLAQAEVRFRKLSVNEIESYLAVEQPFDCAGSAKSEEMGIVLLESIVSDDPTTLIGLPLMRTCRMLRRAGIKLL